MMKGRMYRIGRCYSGRTARQMQVTRRRNTDDGRRYYLDLSNELNNRNKDTGVPVVVEGTEYDVDI